LSTRDYQLYIDGHFVDGSEGERFTRCNPSDGRPVSTFASATDEDVDRAVAAARSSSVQML
jgi:acyl-CoA reductase-like NAD-dependent aldehyde dehydrogenase